MRGKLLWLTVGVLVLLVALGDRGLLGVRSHDQPEPGPLTLHVPEDPEQVSPFLASSAAVVELMLRLAEVKPGETVYDLGCGDARILVMAAQKYGARGVGVELDAEVLALARANVARHGLKDRITLVRGNLFDVDLRDADVVALYLLPEALARLRPMLEQQLRPGARVVTHDFGIPLWQATRIEKLDRGEGTKHTIQLYRR